MGKIIGSSIVIYDDFNNVLIAERGKGKNTPKVWGIFGKDIKGKETEEKCVLKAIDKDLKCTVFDLKELNTYSNTGSNDGELIKGYSGTVKEYLTCHKSINSVKWIGKKEIDNYNFSDLDRAMLEDFWK